MEFSLLQRHVTTIFLCLFVVIALIASQPVVKNVKIPTFTSYLNEAKVLTSRLTAPVKQQLVAEAQKPKKVKATPTPNNDLNCMAENIYYEAGVEGYTGKLAVGQVVLNRVRAKQWAETPCKVIWQGSMSPNSTACQFSWTCQADLPPINKNSLAWTQSVAAATELLTSRVFYDYTDGATHYHANYVNPSWSQSNKLERTTKIDNHIFYKLAKL